MPNERTDLTPYLFIVVLVLVGGFVAYIADSLGRKMGKKRLSFLGLRPRYTATLITVGAGILIPILTIIAMYLLSSDVRQWITRGQQAIRDAQHNKEIADQFEKQAKKAEKRGRELNAINEKLLAQAKQRTAELAKLQEKLKIANGLAKAAQARVKKFEASMKRVEGQLRLTNAAIRRKQDQLDSTLAELKRQQVALSQLRGTVKTATNQLREINEQALQLDHKNQQLEQEVSRLQGELSGLKTQKQQFEEQISSYKETINTYESSIKASTEELGRLRSETEQLQSMLKTNWALSRTRPLIFEASEEVARIQLPPSLSPTAARNSFFDLLQRARGEALKHRANNSPTLGPAGLAPMTLSNPDRIVTIEDQQEAIIRGLTGERNELVFIARSKYNAFEGEYVLLDFVAFRNRMVYSKGKVIAETRIDGRKSEVEILNAITKFIQEDLRTRALADGMIPSSNRSGLGTVSNDEMLDLIKNLAAENQTVRLQALAKDDTKAGDQLELTFRIRY